MTGHVRRHWPDRMLESAWFDRINGVLLVASVTVAAIAAVLRQEDVLVCAMLWVWTVVAIATGYGVGKHHERVRHEPR
jgi:hypothetical protein